MECQGVLTGSRINSKIRINNSLIREGLAEFLGTFILCTFSLASSAMFVLPPKYNSFIGCNLSGGFGAAMAVWCSGGVSAASCGLLMLTPKKSIRGGHINPCLTLAMAVLGRTKWIKVPVYWIGQYLGAFCAAACVFGIYYDAINTFDGGQRQVFGDMATAGIFVTSPQSYLSTTGALFDQVFGSTLFLLCIMAITDRKNVGVPRGLEPVAFGLLLVLLGMTFGANCGYPLNPARDLSPRLFTVVAGYGGDCFSAYNYYFWIPIVGPHIGALCGAWAYLLLVGAHIPDEPDKYEIDDVMKRNQLSTTNRK